jgi:adenosylmethionine-8-amino-7-oxononanoate aminotransferase
MLRTIVNKFIVSPPLTITREQVDVVVGVLDRALAKHSY